MSIQAEIVEVVSTEHNEDLNEKIDKALPITRSIVSNDTRSVETQLIGSVKKLRERVVIYEYMCHKTSRFYNKLNRIIIIPSIIVSSGLALLNSNLDTCQDNQVKIINVVSNGLLTVLISIQNVYRLAEKADYFFSLKKKYSKIHNSINSMILNQQAGGKLDEESIIEQMREYENLDENTQYEFPDHIIRNVSREFSNYNLPIICDGIQSISNDIEPRSKKRNHGVP